MTATGLSKVIAGGLGAIGGEDPLVALIAVFVGCIVMDTLITNVASATSTQDDAPDVYSYVTYYYCDVATQGNMDSVVEAYEKPVFDQWVEDGKLMFDYKLREGVAQGNAGMRIGRRIEDDVIDTVVGRLVDCLDEHTLAVLLDML